MLSLCHKCENRNCGGKDKPGCAGVMLCTINGKDILENRVLGCPDKRFGPDADATYTKAETVQPIPRQDWPTHICAIAATANDEDIGVGDTLKRNIHRFPEWLVDIGAKFKAWALGQKSCGCEADRRTLNQTYPYTKD